MAQWSVPDDVNLHIASLLDAPDVCSLGGCSRAWRRLCKSDCLWLALARDRWPSLDLETADQIGAASSASQAERTGTASHSMKSEKTSGKMLAAAQRWRDFYISKHEEMASCASSLVSIVEQCSQNGSLEVGSYLKALGILSSKNFGFKDVQMFLLAKKHGVLSNVIGLHYSLLVLGIPSDHVKEALRRSQVSGRQVTVSWYTLGRWFYGFRLPDEHLSRKVSLVELVDAKVVLSVLSRGAVHEIIRVQITPVAVGVAQGCWSAGADS